MNPKQRNRRDRQRGVAMLVAMLAVVLLAIIGLGFMFMADTENSANNNYKDAQRAYFASRAGLESVRGMLAFGSPFAAQASLMAMPTQNVPANVIYVENSNGVAVDPTAGATLDTELCKEQFPNLGVVAGAQGAPCAVTPANYFTAVVNPGQIIGANSQSALLFPWVRVTNKQNYMGLLNQMVDGSDPAAATAATKAQQVCWDGATEYPIPAGQTCGGAASPVTGGQMNPVWTLTSLALTPPVGQKPGSRRMTQMEVSIPPPFYILPNGTVSAKAPITIKGNLQVNGYDNCNCTASGANRPGMLCNKKPYAIYSANNISQNGNAATLTSGESQPTLQNVNPWPYDVNALINAYTQGGGLKSPAGMSCTGTPNFNAKPAVYADCGVVGTDLGTYPPPPGPPTTSAGAVPQITYIPGSVKLSGNNGAGVLIIDGDLDVHGGLAFYGLILVRGQINFTGGGSQKVNLYGAILAGEDVTAQDIAIGDNIGGSFSFTYDSCALKQAGQQKQGPPVLLSEHEVMF